MAASKSTTPALSANVVRIDGKAYLRTPEGLIALKAGDRIEQGQEIVVDAKGQLQIRLPNGELLDLGGGRNVRADEDMLGQNTERSEAAVKTPSATDAEAVLAALNAGEDPFATLDPAAAGLGAGGAEGGHGFVRLLRVTEELSPLEFQSGTSFVAEAINIPNGNDDTLQDATLADIQPPSPSISLNSNITPDDIINATEAGQSIAITGVVGGDAKVGDTVTLTVNGKDFTGTVAADKSFSIAVPGADLVADADATIDARVSTTDAAGNTSSATSRESYSVDTNPPSVAVNVTDSALNSGDKVSTVTFTFSEAPGGFSAADITAVGGTISGLTATSDPRVFTATFTATDGFSGTGSVTVANASYTDSAGNPGTAGSDTVAIDTVAPGVSVNIVDTALNNGDKISTVTFTFSEAPSGFSAADITAVGGTISGLTATADPKVFTATFTATDGFSGTGSVTVANASYTDAAGNSGTAGSDTVAINTVAPGVTVDIVDTALNVADKVSTVTFSFSEAPVGFTAADITAVGGTISGLTATADPKVFTATFTAADAFTGTASVSVAAGSYTNAAGNTGTAGTDSVPVDTAPPVPTITLDAAITPDDIINATEAGQSIAITGVVG
ncbi:retention module-containing protein, partial [Uliginosibacterium sp. TH139]|uniref:retention module-containing protein n=1 Tax=Uliginosibacterium sp. TH139 TaxID=2067453 RepID=UPI000CAC0E98